MQTYGYCRISTPAQNIDRQVRNIRAACPNAHIVQEVYTGTKYQGRKELDKLLRIVEPGDYGPLEIEEDKDLCTLLTCTPYGINTQRLLVRGKRIANRAGDDSRITSDAVKVNTVVVAIIISIPLLIISFIVVDMAPRRSKKKKR